jgi:AraC family transcriptional activator of pobA
MDAGEACLHNPNIVPAVKNAAPPQLPTYALYGEAQRTLGVEWLHCESIAERSRLHDWEIRPHRHEALFQILYVRRGRVAMLAEGRRRDLRGPCVVAVPALTAHGFSFSLDVDGLVVTVVEQHFRHLLAQAPGLAARVLRLQAESLPREAAGAMAAAAGALRDEYMRSEPWRALALDAALLRLSLALGRALPDDAPASAAPSARAMAHLRSFRAAVERRFRTQPALDECAAELGVTATQINRVCRALLGQSALAVLHARVVLEAQRELAYTTLSIKQIGLGLGFADAGYFTRFFQRETGLTPTAWRAAASRG